MPESSLGPLSAPLSTTDVLECTVGAKSLVGIPRAHVGQIVEYRCTPLPLASRYVGGLGVHQGEVYVSISLANLGRSGERDAKGVILALAGQAVPWIVEISEIGVFAAVRLADKARLVDDRMPPWLMRAVTPDRRALALIDVPLMAARLAAQQALVAEVRR
jgi:hypothetical protein